MASAELVLAWDHCGISVLAASHVQNSGAALLALNKNVCAAGEVVVRQGWRAQHVCYIRSGYVEFIMDRLVAAPLCSQPALCKSSTPHA